MGKIIVSNALNKAVATTKDIIAKAWSNYDNLQIADLGFNKFLVTFSHENHSKEVMLKALWYIMNHLMCLQYWIPEVSPVNLTLPTTHFGYKSITFLLSS